MKKHATPNFAILSKKQQVVLAEALNAVDEALSVLDSALDTAVAELETASEIAEEHYTNDGVEVPDDEPLIELLQTIRAACEELQPENPLEVSEEDGKTAFVTWLRSMDSVD